MSDPSQLSRRTALAVSAGGLLALGACGEEAGPQPRPASRPEGDAALVDEVVARITATLALSARVPALTAVHTAHLAALEAEPADAGRAPLPRLRKAENDLQRFLVDAALRAESGPLARLLASMSAAVGQQLATFPKAAA